MILISYPSGGFGNFLYHCLTEFSSNTYKPDNNNFTFDASGTSHNTIKYIPIYFQDPENYVFTLPDTDLKCLILCDNGIHNDSYKKINKTFTDSTIIRTVIDFNIRPVIYKTCVIKAQQSDVISETIEQVNTHWIENDNYAIRENFTLLYHNWPFKWNTDPECVNVSLEQLITSPYNTINGLINRIGGAVINDNLLVNTCNKWIEANKKYFKIYFDWQRINSALDNNQIIDISDITDLHDQGYLNYCIERKYNIIIPVYDYRDWFNDTAQIQEMVQCLK